MKHLYALLVALLCSSAVAGEPIPGLTMAEVATVMDAQGFVGQVSKKDGKVSFFGRKRIGEAVLVAEAYGDEKKRDVTLVTVSGSGFPDSRYDVERVFSEFVKLKYEGARPFEMTGWLDGAIDTGGLRVVADVKFTITATEKRRMLEICRYSPESVSVDEVEGKKSESALRSTPLPEGWSKPGESTSSVAVAEPANAKEPADGMTKEEALNLYGKPTMELNEWTHWPSFKVAFEDGVAVKVESKVKP